MNVVMWILGGAALGGIFFSALNANVERGMVLSIIIGVVGGFFGGNVLAPVLGGFTDNPNDFSLMSLVLALASAAVCLVIGDQLSKRFDV